MRLSVLVSMLITALLRSIFLYGFSNLRKGSTALSVFHIIMVLIFSMRGLGLLLLYTLPIAIIYIAGEMSMLLVYSFTISSIPGLWMSLSQFILDLAKGFADPLKYITIYARVTLTSINVLFLLHTVNLSEISVLFNKVRRFSGAYPYLFIRIMSFLIKEGVEVVHTHSLKGERSWKMLAILFIRGDELAKGFSEGLIPKYCRFRPSLVYSLKTLSIQSLLIAYDVMITIILLIGMKL